MNTFLADLHIHSRYSRATSTRLNVPHLAAWSLLKGIAVTATGDFTHPAWQMELRESLVEDEESGLLRLRHPLLLEDGAPGYIMPAAHAMPEHPEKGPLFILQSEISSIYKKDGAVRKVHNLVFMPDFAGMDALSRKLAAIGNLNSDGRPILGLDCQRLLEMVLETDPRGVVIPAHVWTPWFSLFGSKSGFDSLEACFGDLSSHIFALETGLSSDPDMNRLWSGLDSLAMVSNSDAHSGENLGREATVFSGTPSYDGLFNALRAVTGRCPVPEACRYEGTLEFFPEEGKYHLDGHRACNVVLEPEETRKLKGICPVCGKPLTVGVLNRVMTLADRTVPEPTPGVGFASLVPLPELLGELLATGSKSRKVQARHAELIERFGPELHILCGESVERLEGYWPELGEAVRRMRAGEVHRQGGYDGEYGTVRVFSDAERAAFGGRRRGVLLTMPETAPKTRTRKAKAAKPEPEPEPEPVPETLEQAECPELTDELVQDPVELLPPPDFTPAQEAALAAGPGPVLVLAGPGAGKTRTLIGRLARLCETNPPEKLVAVTFTRKAAKELRERLEARLTSQQSDEPPAAPAGQPAVDTLHALALRFWDTDTPAILGDEAARALFMKANEGAEQSAAAWRQDFDALTLHRERMEVPADWPDVRLFDFARRYAAAKAKRNLADYTDLLEHWLTRLTEGDAPRPWTHVLVDEIQDLSPLQLALVRALLPESGVGFFGIGDPDQAIYGFRGAHPDVRGELETYWPDLEVLSLSESYRAGQDILGSAMAVLGQEARGGSLVSARPLHTRLTLFSAPDAMKEAARVADEVAALIGMSSHTLTDARRSDDPMAGTCAPSDIAVLVRMKALMPPLRDALHARGVPVSVPEADAFWQEPRIAGLLALAGRRFGLPMPMQVPDPSDLPSRAWTNGPESLLLAVATTPPFDLELRSTAHFRTLVRQWKKAGSWEALLEEVRMAQELDLVREAGETVRIMTLHASKGLEFRAVFLPCVEEGLLPMFPDLLTGSPRQPAPDALADERRLLYVGLTRAAEVLFVSHAENRMLFGRELTLRPSRWLADLPACFGRVRLVRHVKTQPKRLSLL